MSFALSLFALRFSIFLLTCDNVWSRVCLCVTVCVYVWWREQPSPLTGWPSRKLEGYQAATLGRRAS